MIKEQRHQQMFKLVQETHIIVHNIRDQVATTTQAVGSSSQDTQIVRTNQVNKVLAFQTPSYLKSRKGYGISIPAWLRLPFQYIEFTAWSQTYHTDWHLRDPTQRVHAWTSDAIVAIWKGDTTMMRQMILEGLVSPNDVYADGQSLFKVRTWLVSILSYDTDLRRKHWVDVCTRCVYSCSIQVTIRKKYHLRGSRKAVGSIQKYIPIWKSSRTMTTYIDFRHTAKQKG